MPFVQTFFSESNRFNLDCFSLKIIPPRPNITDGLKDIHPLISVCIITDEGYGARALGCGRQVVLVVVRAVGLRGPKCGDDRVPWLSQELEVRINYA